MERASGSPLVVCVVLNWNGWRDTLCCLRALGRIEYGMLQAVVVDNRSTDDSVERIRKASPDTPLIESATNRGFGAGNNLGIRWALEQGARYIWLLNNDTEPTAAALRQMVVRAEEDVSLGAIGSVLHYRDRPETVQAWGGGRVNLWRGISEHAVSPRPDAWFDYLTAASLLVRRETIEQVGMFDEGFFLYWEDTDLGFRIRTGGWRLGVSADAIVLHAEGASTGKNLRLVDRFSTSSGMRFLGKHAPAPAVSWMIFLGTRLLRRVARGEWKRVAAVWDGAGEFWRSR